MRKFKILLSELIQNEKVSDSICEQCHRKMKLKVIHKARTRFNKHHKMYECICGNKFRKRSRNEILRDLGEREKM